MKRELQIEEEAEYYGSRGLPGPSEVAWDGPQRRVHWFLQREINDAYRRANQRLAFLRAQLDRNDVRPLIQEIKELPTALKAQADQELADLVAKLQDARSDKASAESRIRSFQERYGVERGPELKEGWEVYRMLALTLLIAFGQMIANAMIFAQGLRFGVAMGLISAALIGAGDVLLHSWLGSLSRRVLSPPWTRRFVGGVLVALSIVSVTVVNLVVVHLRLVIRDYGFDGANTLLLDSVLNNTFGFSDSLSYLLLFVGVVCSTAAFLTGLQWNDPIPEFRKHGRTVQVCKNEIAHYSGRIQGIRRQYEETYQREMARRRKRLAFRIKEAERRRGEFESTFENLETHITDAKGVCDPGSCTERLI